MATKEEMAAILARRIERKLRAEFSWSDLVSAVQAASTAEKNAIVAGVQGSSAERAGQALLRICRASISTEAQSEADAMLLDDSLDLTELDRVL